MLETLLSEEEFRSIPGSISNKLDALLQNYIESYKQSQGLFGILGKKVSVSSHSQIFLFSAEEYEKLNNKIAEEVEKNERISIVVEQKHQELEKVEKVLEARDRENLQLKADIIRFRLLLLDNTFSRRILIHFFDN